MIDRRGYGEVLDHPSVRIGVGIDHPISLQQLNGYNYISLQQLNGYIDELGWAFGAALRTVVDVGAVE